MWRVAGSSCNFQVCGAWARAWTGAAASSARSPAGCEAASAASITTMAHAHSGGRARGDARRPPLLQLRPARLTRAHTPVLPLQARAWSSAACRPEQLQASVAAPGANAAPVQVLLLSAIVRLAMGPCGVTCAGGFAQFSPANHGADTSSPYLCLPDVRGAVRMHAAPRLPCCLAPRGGAAENFSCAQAFSPRIPHAHPSAVGACAAACARVRRELLTRAQCAARQ
jgi:hypothetical protein